jgi:hypothetical protein
VNQISKEGMTEMQLALTGLNIFISQVIAEAGIEPFNNYEVLLVQERLHEAIEQLSDIRNNNNNEGKQQ